MKERIAAAQSSSKSFGGTYFLAMIGSAVYFLQQVDGFWNNLLALLKALVWPAFLIFYLLKYLHG